MSATPRRRSDGAPLVARMERSGMRERPVPDYASLHPGYKSLPDFEAYDTFSLLL
jgi:hypothetical protein